jgi:serine/threonine protein kinase
MITDFGLSKVMWEVANTTGKTQGGLAGTPGFVAPEVLTGEPVSAAADVYAFAMTLFELVSRGGYPMSKAGNVAAVSLLFGRR